MTLNAKLGNVVTIETKSHTQVEEYTITIKPTTTENKKLVCDNDLFLLEFYIGICNKYNFVRLVSTKEVDSKNIPHIHGTILTKKSPFVKPVYGWSIHLKKKSSSYWDDYMRKQFYDIRKEQEKIKKYYQKSYQFIDNKHTSPFILQL